MRFDAESTVTVRPSGGRERSVVLFRAADGEFAVDAGAARHVEQAAAFADRPGRLDGRSWPPTPLRAMFGLPPAPAGHRVLVESADGRRRALEVDAVLTLARLDATAIVPLPAVCTGPEQGWFAGLGPVGQPARDRPRRRRRPRRGRDCGGGRPHPMSRGTRSGRLLAAIGGARLAVAAAHLVEVARVNAVTWVPCLDPTLLGVARHRDRLVPVVDGRRRLGAETAGPPPWLCVFVRTALGVVAVPVDAVLGFDPAADAGPDGAPCVDLAAIGITGGAEDGPRAAD